jgi:endonuclease/exonuclease/phosphatase family metal-dependent hydrolase
VAKTAEAVDALDASLTVLQEVRRPPELRPGEIWMGISPRNGVAVVPRHGFEVALGPVAPEAAWSILPLIVTRPIELRLLMVWTRQEHGYVQGLDAALTTYASFLMAAPTVVIGDFNANAIWDSPRRKTDFSRVAMRLADQFGLASAYHACTGEAYGSESRATHYFWRQRSRPFHIDYCFVPTHWVQNIKNVSIRDEPPWDALSDHRPLVIDFEDRAA